MTALMSDIYDAAIIPDLWTEVLDRLVVDVGARSAALISSHQEAENEYAVGSLSTNLKTNNRLPEYFQKYQHFEQGVRDYILGTNKSDLVTDRDVWPDRDEFDNRPDVLFLMEHMGFYRRLVSRLNDHHAWYDIVGVQFDNGIRELTDAHFAPFKKHLPFISQVVALSKNFHALKDRFRAVLAALDRYKVPVILLTSTGHAVLYNSAAEVILSKADGLTLGARRLLQVASPDQRAQLQELIARTAATARGEGDTASGGMLVARPSGADPFYVEVSPLRDSDREVDARYQGAMLTIYDPDYAPLLDLAGFAAVHGLTPAEREVASLIVDGAETTEIAERRNTSLETTRNQVKSILRKTRSRTRTELVRRAVTSTVPVERDEGDDRSQSS